MLSLSNFVSHNAEEKKKMLTTLKIFEITLNLTQILKHLKYALFQNYPNHAFEIHQF